MADFHGYVGLRSGFPAGICGYVGLRSGFSRLRSGCGRPAVGVWSGCGRGVDFVVSPVFYRVWV